MSNTHRGWRSGPYNSRFGRGQRGLAPERSGGDCPTGIDHLARQRGTGTGRVQPEPVPVSQADGEGNSPGGAIGPPSLERAENSTDSPGSPVFRTDGHSGAEEEPWSQMNRRRAELIFRKNRKNLDDAELSELEQLQTLSRSRMQHEFPGPALIDEKLERIDESLRGDGIAKVGRGWLLSCIPLPLTNDAMHQRDMWSTKMTNHGQVINSRSDLSTAWSVNAGTPVARRPFPSADHRTSAVVLRLTSTESAWRN